MKSKKILSWIAFLFWMFLIFFFSSQGGDDSAELSGGILEFINQILPFSLSLHVIRKIAHFTEFFILGVLAFNLLRYYFQIDKKLFLKVAIFCFFYACSDELHQLFIEGRGPSIMDVGIDFSGSLVSLFLIYLFITYKKRKKA